MGTNSDTLAADPGATAEWRRLRTFLTDSTCEESAKRLAILAREVRSLVVRTIDRAQVGHMGGDLSVTDILVTLFGGTLAIDPQWPAWPERDRLILSKGHCSVALYATLARCGFFAESELARFAAPLSPFNGHPDRNKVPGVEANTGPLGHGLPIGVGTALAARLRSSRSRTVVVAGDGELQEGSNWEAAMAAAHHELASLLVVVDRNQLQQGDWTEDTCGLEPLADKWRSFGWEVRTVDGHDHGALIQAFGPSLNNQPVLVLARTVKGRGVSFMEGRVEWHHKVPSTDEVAAALEELAR